MSDRTRFAPWGTPGLGDPSRTVPPAALRSGRGPMLPFGAGRSYGDSCALAGGHLIDGRRDAVIHDFDPATGTITADAGVPLAALLARIAPTHILPVLPGTQFATLGGAIANDVHGKNHHRRGSFGAFVSEIILRRSDVAGAIRLKPGMALFAATVGGMGMTGRIERARLRVLPVAGTDVRESATRLSCLEDYFARAEAADDAHEYAVAWIDSLARGKGFGRGHLIVGDHDPEGGVRPPRGPLARVPFTPPASLLNGLSVRAFNAAYFHAVPAAGRTRTVPCDAFFFPLDRVLEWNRLYGPRGLHQHQSVIPHDAAPQTVRRLLELAQEHGHASFLTVLKRLGPSRSAALMSFARPGYTLTLDFADRGTATLRLLDALDAVTLDAGGAVNPYKDRRMSAATFARSFPQWQRVEAARDPAILSDFWRRTARVLAGEPSRLEVAA